MTDVVFCSGFELQTFSDLQIIFLMMSFKLCCRCPMTMPSLLLQLHVTIIIISFDAAFPTR